MEIHSGPFMNDEEDEQAQRMRILGPVLEQIERPDVICTPGIRRT
jgi:hypothetical protein